jgi:hypothetical protein
MPKLPAAGGGGEHRCAVGVGQLAGAGQEIGVQMGVRGERHPQPPLLNGRPHGAQVAAGVHHQGPTVAEVGEVGAVAQPLVDQRHDGWITHRLSSGVAAGAGWRAMTST